MILTDVKNWIKVAFSDTFKVIFPFVMRFIEAEAKGLGPIVLATIEEIALLPNFNSMTFLEKLGEAIPKIEAKAIEIGQTFTHTDIINHIQAYVTEEAAK